MSKQNIVQLCRKLYKKGFVVADDGNISIRIENGIYVTGTGTYFSEITELEIVELGRDGNTTEVEKSHILPTSELAMHLEVYSQRKDISAVIHAHPPYSTAFSLLDKDRIDCLLTEVKYTLKEVPIAPFATPGTEEVPLSIRDLVKEHDGIILSNHGVLTMGNSLESAFWNLERVEHFAKTCYLAQTLKGME